MFQAFLVTRQNKEKSRVEEGRGGLSRGQSLRFPSPLIKPDVPISGIRLSDWLHCTAHGGGARRTRRSRNTCSSPKTCSRENRFVPRPCTLCRLRRKCRTRSPDYPCCPSNVPCPLPRRTEQGHASMACLFVLPSPNLQVGRRPHWFFRGLLRLHSRYGPPDRSTAQGGLCHEASARPVTRPNRSSATGLIDNYPGGTSLH